MSGQEFTLVAIVVGLIVGMICGAVPLFIGASKNQIGLGITAFISCTVSGVVLGMLLAIPMSAVFVWLINNASKKINING